MAWRSILVGAVVVQIALNVIVMVLSGSVIPPLVIASVLLAVGLVLLRFKLRIGAAVLGVLTLLHIVTSAPFFVESLVHPETFADFSLGWATVISGLLAIVAAVPVWRGTEGPAGRPRALALGAVALVVALAAVSLVVSLTYESVSAQSGDILISAEDTLFQPEEISAGTGEAAVHVENADQFRHTFTIDELEVDVELPAGKAARATFDAEPGEYVFYCSVPGHEAMKGTLVVE